MNERIELARFLISRLERISADSYWAHQASGVRGALLRCLEQGECQQSERLGKLIDGGFKLLEQAARELRAPRLGG
ncbi:MAG: hypothetical protein P8074_21620 [Anaerolineales bacterium]|jgi:hypothetical protein